MQSEMSAVVRDYRLVNYLGEWQVCSKARRLVAGKARAVWIYGEERLPFCDVGRESDRRRASPAGNKVPISLMNGSSAPPPN